MLGDGFTANRTAPVQVVGLTSGVTQVAVGYTHACAIHNGGVKCWGTNGTGQLGIGTLTASNVPVEPTGMGSGVTGLMNSSSYGSDCMAFLKSGALYGTGADHFGDTAQMPISTAPTAWNLPF
jgi:alpha-tubulin suppressor-like RCC1 family protein